MPKWAKTLENRRKKGIKKTHIYIVIQKKCLPLRAFWHNEIEIWGVKPP